MKNKTSNSFPLLMLCLLLGIYSSHVVAQNNNNNICEDGDCPSSLLSIQLNEPSEPQSYTKARTDKFKQAYTQFQKLRPTYANKADWKDKYESFQLSGKSCLKHYELESAFGEEYINNPDFQKFINDQNISGNGFIRRGFKSSLRGLNLEKRMRDNCPEEAKGLNDNKHMGKDYMDLGKHLGYFDEKGQTLKQLEQPKEATRDLSKNDQIEAWKNQIQALPTQQTTNDKITGINDDVNKAKAKGKRLKNTLSALKPLIEALLPAPLSLLTHLGKIGDKLKNLLDTKLKFPKLGLFDKIKGLFNKGEKLKDRAQKTVDKGKDLQKQYNKVMDNVDKVNDGLNDVGLHTDQLKDELDKLENERQKVMNQLNDKPKKIFDELKQSVSDLAANAENLADKIADQEDAKKKLEKELDDLEKKKADLEKQIKDLENDVNDIGQQTDQLDKDAQQAADEVKDAQKQEQKLDDAAAVLNQVPTKEELEDKILICEEDLKKLYEQLLPIQQTQNELNKQVDKIKAWPGRLWDKIKGVKLFQKQLKDGNDLADKTLGKLDKLTDKANAVGSILEIITGKKTKLQERIEQVDQKVTQAKDLYDNRVQLLEGLKDDGLKLILEKSGIKDQLDKASGDVDEMTKVINDFMNRFKVYEDQSKCDNKELEDQLEDIEKDQEEVKTDADELEKDLEKAEEDTNQIEEDTKAIEEEIKEDAAKAEELEKQKEEIKEEFGKDMDLNPVTPEELTESFEIEREYWDAVFHPDDEVVKGYKGRYFQVRLKDANKNVKLLFGPGEYFMKKIDFRDNYGSVIGAFVTETLHALKKSEQGMVKLFVQGSADIVGQNTFKGNIDSKYDYSSIEVLPYDADEDKFGGSAESLSIPMKGFTNSDLPNLRGRYLKEMIAVYSKKLDPILLEGTVKEKIDKEDRNAIIYLFIPEALIETYESN